jgi:hypothetical protein
MKTDRQRKDAGRAAKLRQVRRRIENGASMVRRMTPVKRAAQAKRERRRGRP